jgi:uncharacterized protein
MAKEFSHEPEAGRYVLRDGTELLSTADYRIMGNQISFHHTYTNPTHRGKGLAGDVVEYAVNDVEATTSYRVVPMCWYVGKWFDEHPERAELLSR